LQKDVKLLENQVLKQEEDAKKKRAIAHKKQMEIDEKERQKAVKANKPVP